jgi:hypothetical protein
VACGWRAAHVPEVNAVNRVLTFATLLLVLGATPQFAEAQSGGDGMREQFEAIIDGLNENTFRTFHDAIDDKALMSRVFGTHVLDEEVKQAFADNFETNLEGIFTGSMPRARTQAEAGGEIIGKIISFEAQDGQARAIVRYAASGYRYSYHSYDLVLGKGGRLVIVDWFDYYQSAWFSEIAGKELLRAMPSQEAVRSILELSNPTEGQLFQVGELFKAVRDQNPRRYFQIHDGLEEALRQDPHVVVLNFQYCRLIGDPTRLGAAVAALVENFPGDALHSLSLGEYYVSRRLFEQAIVEYDRFEGALGFKDGVSEAFKATSAMAAGDFERAQEFALSATQVEPDLELSWWTLLRTRTAAQNYAGATEALTQLEDRFGHLLIPQKLQRDRFLRILIDQQEYKDWRASRDQS